MKKRNTKAFTVVELVIVIAVIAILAAVMIPTFSGLIRKANKSADEAEITSLNTQLAIWDGGISSESDLYAVIAETYGEETAKTFAPRSAKHGLHYWYDSVENKIVLKTYSEIKAMDEQAKADAQASNKITVLSAAEMSEEEKISFQEANKSSFRMFFDRFYIVDRGGSVIGDALNALENGAEDIAAKLDALNNLPALSSKDLKAMAEALLARLGEIAIIGNDTVFVTDKDIVNTIHFMPGIETVPSTDLDYIATFSKLDEKGNSVIIIPTTVTKVAEHSLWFDTANTVKLQTSLADIEAIAAVFQANSTNAIILDKDGNEYTIDGATVSGNGKTESLEYGNKVTSFNLTCPEGEKFYYNSGENTLYVAHSGSGFSLGVNILDATINKDTVVQDVTWSAEGDVSVNNGVVTITAPSKYDKNYDYQGKVIATSVTDANVTAELNIVIITLKNAVVNIGANQLYLDNNNTSNTLTLTYDGTDQSAEYAIAGFIPTYTINDILTGTCCDATPVFTTSGDFFEIVDNNKLKLIKENLSGTKTQTLTVTVGDHIEKTFTVTVIDASSAEFTKKYTNNYLYRVGNANTFTLGSLFAADGNVNNAIVTIYDAAKTVVDRAPIATTGTNVFKATYTANSTAWENGTIQFEGTGVAIIQIKDGQNGIPIEIAVEVVNGKNVTAASDFSGATSYVLLNDITWGTANKTAISGTLYGNGFAINATAFTSATTTSNNALFYLNGGTIDNIVINGPVYPELIYQSETSASRPYYVAGVYTTGNATITNSYISGFRSPVMADSTYLYVENTTLVGGNYANLWLNKGNLYLKNVTTVQEKKYATVGDTSKQILGAGIVVTDGISNLAEITIEGYLNQYNWVTESDKSYLDTDIQSAVSTLFSNSTITHNGRINTGILFMGSRTIEVKDSRSNKASVPYQLVEISPATIYTHVTTNGAVSSFPTYGGYTPNAQMALKPTFKDNLGTTNGKLEYSIDIPNGATCTVDASVYTVSKYTGQDITVNISCNGGTQSGNVFTFSAVGTYTITYEVEDNTFYNADGSKQTDNVIDTYTVTVVVANSNHASAVIDVSGVNKTLYMNLENTYTDSDYAAAFAILDGLKITDYNEDGSSFTVTISANALPTGLTVTASGFKGSATTKVISGKLYMYDSSAQNNQSGYGNITITYKYTGKNGKEVTATVTHTNVGTNSYTTLEDNRSLTGGSSCVTPDTLVTLADGTQKRIDELTYDDKLLVWDFYTGKYVVTPIMLILNHGYAETTVIELTFDDGTVVKAANAHAFFDSDLNDWVNFTSENAKDYLGHNFVKVDEHSNKTVELVSVSVWTEYTEAWTVATANHYNCIAEGMLSITPLLENLQSFTIGENMQYDEAQMQADIEKYGLYDYEEFAHLLTLEEFELLHIAEFKIGVGKGLYTYDEALYAIELYSYLKSVENNQK